MLLHKFQDNWQQQFPHLGKNNCRLLLAVSGGIDSVVLANLLQKLEYDFIIAHCNFQLRGEESERDAAFVQTLATAYNKELHYAKFDTKNYADEQRISIQEAARALRYNWFKKIISESTQGNKQFLIATAHHANDNIETLLINFLRGTGISGLHGIPVQQDKIIRPLLFATREEITSYAATNNLQWVEDSSNSLDKYTRNFFRLQLLPAIKDHFPAVENNLLHNIQRFKETELLYNQAIAIHKKKLVEQKGNEFHIPVLKLLKTEPLHTVLYQIVKAFGFTPGQVYEIKRLLDAETGSYVESADYRIIRNRNWLIIAPQQPEAAQHILIEEGQRKIAFENGELVIEVLSNQPLAINSDVNIACIDASEITFPLLLRKWKQGDYFYPLGMQKKKKLSRFFIDQKLSATEKEKVWVIEMNKKIIWIVGHRIDNRFKLTTNTKQTLRLSYKK